MIRLIILLLLMIFVVLLFAFLKGASALNETEKQIEDEEQIRWLEQYKQQK